VIFIEDISCLCAIGFLLKTSLAGVQKAYYWSAPLLMCISTIIEVCYCLRANWFLL